MTEDINQNLNPNPPQKSRALLVAHIINLILIIAIFAATHYVLASSGCTPQTSFRWSLIAAVVYAVLSTLLVISWLHRNAKQ